VIERHPGSPTRRLYLIEVMAAFMVFALLFGVLAADPLDLGDQYPPVR
jgi:hypothetical protein